MVIHVRNKTMRKRIALILALACIMCLTGCRKNCICIKNNGTSHTYTADEVKANHGTCQNMKYMYSDGTYDPSVSYYSACEWE